MGRWKKERKMRTKKRRNWRCEIKEGLKKGKRGREGDPKKEIRIGGEKGI